MKEHLRTYFADLLSSFGREQGFQIDNSVLTEGLLTWIKANSLRYCFKFDDKHIRLVTPVNQNGSELVSQWGTISYSDLALELKRWCQEDSDRGNDIRATLNRLEGPSYTHPKNGGGALSGYRHLE